MGGTKNHWFRGTKNRTKPESKPPLILSPRASNSNESPTNPTHVGAHQQSAKPDDVGITKSNNLVNRVYGRERILSNPVNQPVWN